MIDCFEQIESVVAKVAGKCLKTKVFKGVMIVKGWGQEEKDDEGCFFPVLKVPPYIEIVANQSFPDLTQAMRDVTVRVTLETCQDEGPGCHSRRESSLGEKLCGITREESNAVSRWRWEASRFNTEEGNYQSEFTATVRLEDSCYEC